MLFLFKLAQTAIKPNHFAGWRETYGDPSIVRLIKASNDFKVDEISTPSPYDNCFTRGHWASFKATKTRLASRQIRRGLHGKKPVSIFITFINIL